MGNTMGNKIKIILIFKKKNNNNYDDNKQYCNHNYDYN